MSTRRGRRSADASLRAAALAVASLLGLGVSCREEPPEAAPTLAAAHDAAAPQPNTSPAPGDAPQLETRADNPWTLAGQRAVAAARARVGDPGRARNAILFVGDGMSIATVTAARILEGQRRGQSGEENALAFETLPHLALAKTYTTDFQVPDSAGTMTAMMSGVKTRSGVLGVDDRVVRGDHSGVAAGRVESLLERAEARGLATGVVSTASVTHATPAACYAHSPERNWESDGELSPAARAAGFPDIARQLVEFAHGDGIEIVLGGGRGRFLPKQLADPEHSGVSGLRQDGRNLVDEWRARHPGGVYVWRRAEFAVLDAASAGPILGLFEPADMQFESDRGGDPAGEPSLAEMTALAIEVLSRDPEGFVLVVEAGRIDHAHHLGNAQRALVDTIALSDAVRVALARTSEADTLIVVTADHSHTLTLAGYPARGNDILGLVRGPADAEGVRKPQLDAFGRPYTTLGYANGAGPTGSPKTHPSGVGRARRDLTDVDTTSVDYRQESVVPLGTETHAGEDVAIYAGGAGAALIHGVREQSYVYHAIVEALSLR